jgi:hypothetical protein
MRCLDLEEELRKMSLIKEKFANEREHMLQEMKRMEKDLKELKSTNEGQLRLIQNVTGHVKNQVKLGDSNAS